MINIIISGANGQMGKAVARVANKDAEVSILAGLDVISTGDEGFPVVDSLDKIDGKADVLIDFSRPAALPAILSYAKRTKMAVVLATTGYTKEDKKAIKEASEEIPVFFVANMSLGVNLQMDLCKQAAGFFGQSVDIEIIEKHHNRKVDSPSGTALALADSINEAYDTKLTYKCGRCGNDPRKPGEIGIHSIRGGSIVGEHQVLFIKDDEIVEINHIAQSKEVFAGGAIRAAKYIIDKPAGLYNMHDIIYETRAVTNVTVEKDIATITLPNINHSAQNVADIFEAVAKAGISVDIITQTAPKNGTVDICFSILEKDVAKATVALKSCGISGPMVLTGLCKLTVEGAGMERKYGVAARLFSSLAKEDINIAIISTSEIKISFCTDSANLEKAKRLIVSEFDI